MNGILFPGGGEYFEFARILTEIVVKANDAGDYFPIWGTCFGLQGKGVSSSNHLIFSPY